MSDTFRRELQQFDRERVLPAWDGLIRKQQSRLESLGVPTMFPTTIPADRQVCGLLDLHAPGWYVTHT